MGFPAPLRRVATAGRLGHHHHRRANDAAIQFIALLHHCQYVITSYSIHYTKLYEQIVYQLRILGGHYGGETLTITFDAIDNLVAHMNFTDLVRNNFV